MQTYIKSKEDHLREAIGKHQGFIDEHVRNYKNLYHNPAYMINEYI